MNPFSTLIEPLIKASWNGVSMVSAISVLGIETERCTLAAHSTGPAYKWGAICAL